MVITSGVRSRGADPLVMSATATPGMNVLVLWCVAEDIQKAVFTL